MSAIQGATPTIIQAQIDAINNNKFIDPVQKQNSINALNAQLASLGTYTGNVSNSKNPPNVNAIFQAQQLLTQALGNRVSQITSTPQFVESKAKGGSLQDLNAQLTQQGAYVTTPELNSFNQAIQGVPLTPQDHTNVQNLLNRIQAPVVSSQSTSTMDLYTFLQRSGALNPNPTPNQYSYVPSLGTGNLPPVQGNSYLPPSNLPPVILPPAPPVINPPTTPNPNIVPNIPNGIPFSPPAGGGTSPNNVSTIPTIPIITDLGNYLNSILHTSIDPTILGGAVSVLLIFILLFIFGGIKGKTPQTFKSKLPPLTV